MLHNPIGEVTLEVPASSANLGPGFDSIGVGLGVYDRVSAQVGGDSLVVEVRGESADVIPHDDRHLVWRSMVTMWQRLGVDLPTGLKLLCDNAVPQSRGLGSSASAIVAGVAAAASLAGLSLDDEDDLAIINDVAAALEGHPDNSSASVYGGFTVSWWDESAKRWSTARPRVHPDVRATVFVPDATLATQEARAALAPKVRLRDAAANSGRAALLVHAMTTCPDLLLPATREWLHQEPRRASYPASMALVDRLRDRGQAAVISGAGPSVLVLGTTPIDLDPGAGWRRLEPDMPARGVRQISHMSAHGV